MTRTEMECKTRQMNQKERLAECGSCGITSPTMNRRLHEYGV